MIGRRRQRWIVAFAGVVGMLVIGSGWFAPSVGAHSVLESSSPASGETVPSPPAAVTLTFNEPVSLPPNAVRLLDVEGEDVHIDAVKAVDAVVTAEIPTDLANGSYVVAWKVMSADTHPVSGAFTFAVGAPSVAFDGSDALAKAQASDGTSTAAQVLVDIAMGLAYAGVLLAVGIAAFVVFVDGVGPASATHRRWLAIGAAVGSFGFVLGVVAEAILLDGDGFGVPSGTALRDQLTGSVGLQALLGVVGLAAVSRRLSAPSVVRRLVAIDGGAVALGAFVVVGHTRTASPIGLTIAADLVHLAAAAVWTGGLVALLIALGQVSGDDDSIPVERARLVSRFSGFATVSIVLVLVAGSIMGWRIVGSWQALFHTTYGVLLLVKVGLFAVVATVGAFNRFRLVGLVAGHERSHEGASRLRRTLVAEIVVVLAIVGVTAALTSTSPNETVDASGLETTPITCEAAAAMQGMPGMENMDHQACVGTTTSSAVPFDPTAGDGTDGGALVESGPFGDGLALVTVSPGKVGTNTVSISLTDASGTSIDPKDPPTVEFRLREKHIGPITLTAERVGPGAFRVTQDFVLAGDWEINVSAVVSDFEQPQAIVHLPIQG